MHLLRKVLFVVVVLGLNLGGAVGAQAQEDLVPEKRLQEVKKKDGWDFLFTPGLNTSLSDNRSVIGQQEGMTMTVGMTIAAGANWRKDVHELRTGLNITETFTRTPVLEEFVKSTDMVKLEAIYLYHLMKWLGPFAKFNIDTALLEGFDARPDPVTWTIAYRDGSTASRSGFHLRLTDGFQPLTLKETAGFFAKPYENPQLNVETRLGFGGMHVFADDQLAIQDKADTPQIEVAELKSFSQAGGVLDLVVFGSLYDNRVLYRVSAGFMMPFVNDLAESDDRNLAELTNIELEASLTFKLLDWLSIDYVFRAIRQPQLLDEFQVQNNLLLTASYSFFKPKKEQ